MVIFALAGDRLDPCIKNVFSPEIVLTVTLPKDKDEGFTDKLGKILAVSLMSTFEENGARVNDPATVLLSRS